MKKYLLIILFATSVLLFSFRCTTSIWGVLIELNVQNEEGEKIDNLDIKFIPNSEGKNISIDFYPTYSYTDGNKIIDTYNAELFNCPMADVPLQKTYLTWDKLDDILDNYVIKISDPVNKTYEDYNTSTLRELIENSEYKNRKLSGYDENGKVLPPELTFKIQLTKKISEQL